MFTAEYLQGCMEDIRKKLHQVTDPALVPPWIFQRQMTLTHNKAYGFLYYFEHALICEATATIEKRMRVPRPNEKGFIFVGSVPGTDLGSKIDLITEAIRATSDHAYLQSMGFDSHKALNFLPNRIARRTMAMTKGN